MYKFWGRGGEEREREKVVQSGTFVQNSSHNQSENGSFVNFSITKGDVN